MNTRLSFIELCKKAENNEWNIRILTELEYMMRLYEAKEQNFPALLEQAVQHVHALLLDQGTLTRQNVMEIETLLMPLSKDAKAIEMLCIAHAHIDMNWEWGTPETVGVVIDTFQTMLDLMDEYPDFTFSQSQAATYQMVEEYCPSMIAQIRRRVHEGRWEVAASTWVEPDKNMSGSEAMARHVLYTKRYMAKLFGLSPDQLEVDFEPDTFGHSANLPEILQQGGVKYYYHCRGRKEGERKIYRWRSPSGAELLCFEEPYWYSSEVTANIILPLPQFCKANNTHTFMHVYGVGDHGGGPTRRDLNRLIDMASWPLAPTIRFGTLHEYFQRIESHRDAFPVVEGELNCLFTGCYTSQARLKHANRTGEDRLYDAEMLSVWAGQVGDVLTCFSNFEKAWQKVLFNQFHDILPGSCAADSCHQALGFFHEALCYTTGNANRSLKWLASKIATNGFGLASEVGALANGAGVGYNVMSSEGYGINAGSPGYGFSGTSHGDGNIRVFILFNTTQFERDSSVDLTLWDWPYPIRMTEIVDSMGTSLPFSIREEGVHYWGHHYTKLVTHAKVPAIGYTCVAVRYAAEKKPLPIEQPTYGQLENDPISWHSSFARPPVTTPRVTRIIDEPIILENDLVRAEFSQETMHLMSFTDKRTGAVLITPDRPSAFFRLINENDYFKRSSWTIGPYGKVQDINAACMVRVEERALDSVEPFVRYSITFNASKVETTISLAPNSATLRFSIKILWREFGEEKISTPLLQFFVPFAFDATTFRYDIPCASIDREIEGHDVPAIGYAAPIPCNQHATIGLMTNCKYGYRGERNSLSVNLIHASYFPDPCPDIGEHKVEVGLTAIQDVDSQELIQSATTFTHPIIAYSASIHSGILPVQNSFLHLEGEARLIAVKRCEDHPDRLILRICQQCNGGDATIHTSTGITGAWITDLAEQEWTPINFDKNQLTVNLPPYAVRTVALALKPVEE